MESRSPEHAGSPGWWFERVRRGRADVGKRRLLMQYGWLSRHRNHSLSASWPAANVLRVFCLSAPPIPDFFWSGPLLPGLDLIPDPRLS